MDNNTPTNLKHFELKTKNIENIESLVDFDAPQIKKDVIKIILQYLEEEGYIHSKTVLYDEAGFKSTERKQQKILINKMKKSILVGDWPEVEKLFLNQAFKNNKHFMYAVYKQQFVEQLERNEFQKAFNHLTRKIKPLERWAAPGEFKELCYALTVNSFQDCMLFKNWEGVAASREKLIEHFQNLFRPEFDPDDLILPASRLKSLIRHACAYQIEFSRYQPLVDPKIDSIVGDFHPFIIPNSCKFLLAGHSENIKSLNFVGTAGKFIVSGSSDKNICLWGVDNGKLVKTFKGHTSRIWDLNSNKNGSFIVSASSDRTIKLWSVFSEKEESIATLSGHVGDVYTCFVHSAQSHIISGGYDKKVCIFDIEREELLQTFVGHELSVSSCTCNRYGNIIITGSKDTTVKFWDVSSGVCVKSLTTHFGEVTSVEASEQGDKLLVASKDNSNRLWDLRMLRPTQKFRGHYNTSKNFVKANFGPSNKIVMGGSEDGNIFLWDIDTGKIVQRLRGHNGTAYRACWNNSQSLMASCGDDGLVKVWWYDAQERGHE